MNEVQLGMEPVAEVRNTFAQGHSPQWVIDVKYPLPSVGTKLYTAAQVLAMQSELEQIGAVAACFGADWPDVEGEPEVLRRVKWAARNIKTLRPMTDDQIRKWWASENGLEDLEMCKLSDFTQAVRAIEAKHGITDAS